MSSTSYLFFNLFIHNRTPCTLNHGNFLLLYIISAVTHRFLFSVYPTITFFPVPICLCSSLSVVPSLFASLLLFFPFTFSLVSIPFCLCYSHLTTDYFCCPFLFSTRHLSVWMSFFTISDSFCSIIFISSIILFPS